MTRFRENSVPFAFHRKPQTTVLPVSILQISSIVIIKHFLLSNCHTFVVPNTTFYLWIQERKKKKTSSFTSQRTIWYPEPAI